MHMFLVRKFKVYKLLIKVLGLLPTKIKSTTVNNASWLIFL